MSRFRVGAAEVTVICPGYLRFDLSKHLQRPVPEGVVALPVQSVHIECGTRVVLVDAVTADIRDPEFHLPGAPEPRDLVEELQVRGLSAEAVDTVVLTHAHFDHVMGVTRHGQLSFPRARHYLGAQDLARAQQHPWFAESLGRVPLHLVGADIDLGDGLSVLATPGETPGHLALQLVSQGQTLLCLGDIVHHQVMFAHPDWHVHWADRQANQASRARVWALALESRALLIPAHVPPGRLLAPERWEIETGGRD